MDHWDTAIHVFVFCSFFFMRVFRYISRNCAYPKKSLHTTCFCCRKITKLYIPRGYVDQVCGMQVTGIQGHIELCYIYIHICSQCWYIYIYICMRIGMYMYIYVFAVNMFVDKTITITWVHISWILQCFLAIENTKIRQCGQATVGLSFCFTCFPLSNSSH